MKRIVIGFLLCLIATACRAQIGIVNTYAGALYSTSTSLTTSTVNASGADYVVIIAGCNNGTMTITDNVGGNTYTQIDNETNGNNRVASFTCSGPNVTGSMSFTVASSSGYLFISAFACTNVASVSPLDGHEAYNGASPGGITPSQTGDLLVAGIAGVATGANSSNTINDGYTIYGTVSSNANDLTYAAAAYIYPGTSTINPLFSSSIGGTYSYNGSLQLALKWNGITNNSNTIYYRKK